MHPAVLHGVALLCGALAGALPRVPGVPGAPAIVRAPAWPALAAGTDSIPADSARADSARADSTLPEAVLVELRVGRLASRTVPAYRDGLVALLPLVPLLELAEVQLQAAAGSRVQATLQPGDVPLVVDAAHDTARVGKRHLALAPRALQWLDGEVYAADAVVDSLLGTPVDVNWEDLTVTLTAPDSLPLARRLAREEARAALRASGDAESPAPVVLTPRRYVGGLVVDYAASAPIGDPLNGSAASLTFGTDVLGGSLEGTVAGTRGRVGAGGAVEGRMSYDGAWTGVWPSNRWVQQLRIGDAVGTGPSPRLSRGVTLTNAPFLRPTFFDASRYVGRLAPGWEVEAYRGGQLVAVDSVGPLGMYGLDLPVEYGDNLVDFVAYGPYGQIRHFDRNLVVLSDRLPAGHLEYGASAGACRSGARCAATGNLDVRYGASSRWTARGGAEYFRGTAGVDSGVAPGSSAGHALHPYAGLAGSPTNALALQLDWVPGVLARSGVRLDPSGDVRLAAGYSRFTAGAPPALVARGARAQATVSAFARPLRRAEYLYLDATADRIETVTGALARARLGGGLQASNVRLQPYVRAERERTDAGLETRPYAGVSAFVVPTMAWGRLLGPTLLRANIEARGGHGLAHVSAFATRPLPGGLRVDVGGAWARGQRQPLWTAVLARDLRTIRSYTSLSAAPGGDVSASQAVQGSAVWNARLRSVSFVPGPSVQRGGISGRVYLDNNVNGRFDAGDEPLSGVTVRAGSTAAASGAGGWFQVWDVVPFQPLPVAVDSMTLASPLWVAPRVASVTPGPNGYTQLDVPVVPGGVVEGRVVLRATGTGAIVRGVGGVRLVLTERVTGERRQLDAFADGGFTAIAVRPGSYELTVEGAALARLDADAAPVRFTVAPNAEGTTTGDLEVALEPRAPCPVALTSMPAAAPMPNASKPGDRRSCP